MLPQKVKWPQFASPQERPLAVTRAINRTQLALGYSFGTTKSPHPLHILHRTERGAQERAHDISHPEETWVVGGSPGLHPPHLALFLIAWPLTKIEQTSLYEGSGIDPHLHVMTCDIILCPALN